MSILRSKRFYAIAILLLIAASVALPFISRAAVDQGGNQVTYTAPSLWPKGYWGQGGLVSCTGNYLTGASQCTSLCDLINTAINVIYFLMTIALFIIMPISFLVGAIMMMISGASPEMLSKGKKVLVGTFIGLAIVLGAYLIVSTAINVLGATGIGGFGTDTCSTL